MDAFDELMIKLDIFSMALSMVVVFIGCLVALIKHSAGKDGEQK